MGKDMISKAQKQAVLESLKGKKLGLVFLKNQWLLMRALMAGRKIYNEACSKCKPKILKNSMMPYKEYCPACQEIAKKYLDPVNALINKKIQELQE